MARNRYPGYCYCCGAYVPTGYGHFERHKGGWRVKCTSGRTVKDTDKEVKKAIMLRNKQKEVRKNNGR